MNRAMNKRLLTAMTALVAVSGAAHAQTSWSNPSNALPVQSTIVGGPWTLNSGGLVTPTSPTNYCVNGVENPNANPTATLMNPFYFPFILGSGNSLIGYFDYRPSSVNEATIAAKSSDAGKSWTFLGQALQLSTACPTKNAATGNDTGLGHPYMLSFGGANFFYLLDRRGGHVDMDGLTVHTLRPTLAKPLNAKPQLNVTAVQSSPVSNVGVIAGWSFDTLTAGAINNAPIADLGPKAASAVAIPLGMTNNYWCSATPNTTTLAAGTGSIVGSDIVADSGSSVSPSNDWRIRGLATTDFSDPCNGWSLSAPQYTQGAQFNVDTSGVANVIMQYDWYSTAQGFRDLQVQYTTDSNDANPVWTSIGTPQIAVPKGYQNQLQVDFTGVAGTGNNPNFGVRFVGVYDPTIPAGSVVINGATVNYGAGQQYSGATTGTNGSPLIYNNNSGNWRFDNVKIIDASKITKGSGGTTDYTTETKGLINPDGILATIPNTYPRQVLYVQKQLSATLPANACPAVGPGGKINYDVDTIRLASTTDGINFTDLGATNLLDPTTKSNLGLRYAAPNGSIIKLSNGKFGMFFGAGNCQDGDSDGFHAIVYAENTDSTMLNWTVVNGMNNPIAEVGYGQTPEVAPLTSTSSQTSTGQNGWFGGRVYTPQAIYHDANHVSLIFDGYDYGYFGTDISNYRTVGQITLTSSIPLLP
jgi:hypothetical protein